MTKKYKITLDTQDFIDNQKLKERLKEWENATINSYMEGLNKFNYHNKEFTIQEVEQKLNFFFGRDYPEYKSDAENYFSFFDNGRSLKQVYLVKLYGIAQGYIDLNKKIKELEKNEEVKISFSEGYDTRQPLEKKTRKCFINIKLI